MAPLYDLIDLLGAFDEESVEYLLVGGQAVALHGAPRFTKDADIWVHDVPDNCARTVRALGKFGAARIDVVGAAAAVEPAHYRARPPKPSRRYCDLSS